MVRTFPQVPRRRPYQRRTPRRSPLASPPRGCGPETAGLGTARRGPPRYRGLEVRARIRGRGTSTTKRVRKGQDPMTITDGPITGCID
ncbi:hypothetical protein Arub01_21360 [Actinomadura rubrobrunea]|uniref:Uncharacterized protein n=1 Tax=Actinomadura rubrobrunea TaxID=115335 RepID=A0A9W6PUK3_9ACTN|nr:hypothetical protein Arub01_21360 [Actinomadura rubrobrunea]